MLQNRITFNHENFSVTTTIPSPKAGIGIVSNTRPMTESEIILSKMRGHSREAIAAALGFPMIPKEVFDQMRKSS